ncbi:insulinase family protein [Pectinatus haikarae]|uniref:Zn-dependent M16 (Insulinase) family peptidase n=1 Tax=Pectinatus haikarae TaxID=349096 RepID=A0ABT9YA57_9FIRM|nr:insulinase family protein [Pectinatus haikarae]MDQ0204713.1 Zn-dependent M16 (insulinase) family peptidase [Pectinatus haikarae]
MNFENNKIYHGFRLVKSSPIKELDAESYQFIHEKSGARLLFLDTDDDNKVFSISFRTTPTDDTGVAHIVEHSTLCGSRKFRTKEPFVELLKGSLNTFLNAMTFPDKTMYPVASQNDKDFQNLIDVYLDAVFYPLMTQMPEILMQEGWHYEIDNTDAPLRYSGVVYNEMKGALSSPESLLERRLLNSMFPDNTYAFESGGDPESIPSLTQKDFIEFHQKYYHPANSYIYLYGKMDIMQKLAFLDDEYLSHFEKIDIVSHIDMQLPFKKEKRSTDVYPVSSGEDKTGKTFLSYNFVYGTALDTLKCFAVDLLDYVLLKSQSAPLRNALIKAGIGADVSSSFDTGLLQPWWNITVTGAEPENTDKFRDIFIHTIKELVEKGIDKKLLRAAFNITEFKLREADFGQAPKGLIYNIHLMKSWLYDGDPVSQLQYESLLAEIKEKIETDYFEKLLQEVLLDNQHKLLFTFIPDDKIAAANEKKLTVLLQKKKEALSAEEIETIIANTKKLKQRQQTPDSPEALQTIPMLALSDIDKKARKFIIEKKTIDGIEVLAHNVNTNDIAYLDLYFDASSISSAKLPLAFLLVDILSKVATEKYSYEELANAVNLNTGGISFDLSAYSKIGEPDSVIPKLIVRSKALTAKLPELFELLEQLTVKSCFTDKARLKELVVQSKANMELDLLNSAQQVVASRLSSYFSPSGAYNEQGGLTFYSFIKDLADNFDERYDLLQHDLAKLFSSSFTRKNLLVSITLKDTQYDAFSAEFSKFAVKISDKAYPLQKFSFEINKKNEGFQSSSQVQYVGRGANFIRNGYQYTGKLAVLSTILRCTYFWNKIRVQGGAYGAFVRFGRDGELYFGSYRDPNLMETLQAYDGTVDFLKNMNISDREMTKYIIGTISNLDVPLTPSAKGKSAAAAYICGITDQSIQKIRDEVLSASQEEIKDLNKMIDACLKDSAICVVGNEEKLKENQTIFKSTCNIFEASN